MSDEQWLQVLGAPGVWLVLRWRLPVVGPLCRLLGTVWIRGVEVAYRLTL